MSFAAVFFILLSLFLAVLLGVSVYFNIKHGILLLSIQDAVEKSLDILDKKYERISDILEIPIFFDSVEVRQVIAEIQNARDAILYIANEISGIDQSQEHGESENDKT